MIPAYITSIPDDSIIGRLKVRFQKKNSFLGTRKAIATLRTIETARSSFLFFFKQSLRLGYDMDTTFPGQHFSGDFFFLAGF